VLNKIQRVLSEHLLQRGSDGVGHPMIPRRGRMQAISGIEQRVGIVRRCDGASRIDEHDPRLTADPIVDLPDPRVLATSRGVLWEARPCDGLKAGPGRLSVHSAELLGHLFDGKALIDVVDACDNDDSFRRGGHDVALEAATNLIAALPVHASIEDVPFRMRLYQPVRVLAGLIAVPVGRGLYR
jgi:hypothetical protein